MIPLFLEFLNKSPLLLYQKQSSFIVQSVCYNGKHAILSLPKLMLILDANKDVVRDAGGIPIIVRTIAQHKSTNPDIAINCVNALLLLISNGTVQRLRF